VFKPASDFAAQCAVPRGGVDPGTGGAYPDRAGSTLTENNWLRSWTNDLYLWFGEVADQNPSLFSTTASYFKVLKTQAITSTGAAKDKFHFTYRTSDWQALAGSGIQAGYGIQWVLISATPPRRVVVAYIEPGSPATAPRVNIPRGAEVLKVDGVDVVNDNTQAGVNTLNAGLFPSAANESHTLQILDQPSSVPRTLTLTSAAITSQPVQHVQTVPFAGGLAGYMLFNDQLATSEAALVAAFTTLQAAHVTDLVLDLRYNGGGYLDIASEVAYMIAGPTATAGVTFDLTQFNSKHPSTDPVTGQPITATPFHATTQGFSTTSGQALPTLSLARVVVITGPDTCSASEAIMNGLRGANVQVIQIGSTTCGKPYGFYPQDNCGTTYFSIQFQGVNAAGFGDYPDGFSPQNSTSPTNATLTGCSVADDFTKELGDATEGRLSAALAYLVTPGACPAPTGQTALAPRELRASAMDGRLPASPLRNLRLLSH
jgi:C-terminal processing protease CtpA/Prc